MKSSPSPSLSSSPDVLAAHGLTLRPVVPQNRSKRVLFLLARIRKRCAPSEHLLESVEWIGAREEYKVRLALNEIAGRA